jgi:hypothetical protein
VFWIDFGFKWNRNRKSDEKIWLWFTEYGRYYRLEVNRIKKEYIGIKWLKNIWKI